MCHEVRGGRAIQGTVGGVVALVRDEGVGVSWCTGLGGGTSLLFHHLFAVVLPQMLHAQGLAE